VPALLRSVVAPPERIDVNDGKCAVGFTRHLDALDRTVITDELVRVEGTPLAHEDPLDPLEFVRTIAVARITMPKARVRLSAGRQEMSEAVQALCFLAGANSIFYGEKLLTTGNPDVERDRAMLASLGMTTRITQG